MESCPECSGDGYLLDVDMAPVHGCGGDPQVCASLCPVPEQVQIQVQCPGCGGNGAVWVDGEAE